MEILAGVKKGMTRVFDGDKSVAVTIVDLTGSVVSYADSHGIEIGTGGKLNKPIAALAGKYKDLGYVPKYRAWFPGVFTYKVGDAVTAEGVAIGSRIDIVGVTKGKGFAGVVKRWGFHGGPKTRGQSDKHRSPGSIGAGTDPGRVLKGKKMGGRMGGENMTIRNKKIVGIKDSYLLVSGAVPGNTGDLVSIKIV